MNCIFVLVSISHPKTYYKGNCFIYQETVFSYKVFPIKKMFNDCKVGIRFFFFTFSERKQIQSRAMVGSSHHLDNQNYDLERLI